MPPKIGIMATVPRRHAATLVEAGLSALPTAESWLKSFLGPQMRGLQVVEASLQTDEVCFYLALAPNGDMAIAITARIGKARSQNGDVTSLDWFANLVAAMQKAGIRYREVQVAERVAEEVKKTLL